MCDCPQDIQRIANQSSDVKQREMAYNQYDDDWQFINHLVYPLHLYVRPYVNKIALNPIGAVGAKGKINVAAKQLRAGDIIIPCVKNGKALHFATAEIELNESRKVIDIGVVTYDSYGDNNITQTGISSEITGFYISNLLSVPIDVYYGERKMISLPQCDNLSYLGGSKSIAFFNNGGQGMHFGQKLVFKFYGTQAIIAEYVLFDNAIKRLYIGAVLTRDVEGMDINVPFGRNAYSFANNLPDFTDVKYFPPKMGWNGRSCLGISYLK
jgi:hypothetical protein